MVGENWPFHLACLKSQAGLRGDHGMTLFRILASCALVSTLLLCPIGCRRTPAVKTETPKKEPVGPRPSVPFKDE